MFRKRLSTLAVAALMAATGCNSGEVTDTLAEPAVAAGVETTQGLGEPAATPEKITLSSPAFQDGEALPSRFTCDGGNVSPPLNWTDVPEGTRSLVLIVSDPDAPRGTFSHWVVFNLPPDLAELEEGVGSAESLGSIAGASDTNPIQATNGFNNAAYNGPCPPEGAAHRYVFELYALDEVLALDESADRQRLLDALDGHVLAQGRITATFSREQAG